MIEIILDIKKHFLTKKKNCTVYNIDSIFSLSDHLTKNFFNEGFFVLNLLDVMIKSIFLSWDEIEILRIKK